MRLAGVAPEVNLRNSMQVGKRASGFKTQGRRHQKSKTGISMAPQKDICRPKFKRKEKNRRGWSLWIIVNPWIQESD